MAARLLRGVLRVVLPAEHRAVVLAHLDADGSTWQLLVSVPGAVRLRMQAARHGVWDDVTQGLRVMRRHPGFAIAVTLTLALGVAATNAVTTVAYAVLMRPLPFPEADRVISFFETDGTGTPLGPNQSWPDFLAYRERNTTLAAMAGYNGGSRTLQLDGREAERVPIASVTGAFFDVIGVTPLMGRTIAEADTVDGAPMVVVVSHAAWRQRFGGDPGIVGRLITMNGQRVSIVGVLPPGFEFAPRSLAELWLPLRPTAQQRERKFFHWMSGIARLKPGVTLPQAEADLDAIARTFAQEDPKYHASSGVQVATLRERLVRDARPMLLVLVGAALLVLIVASANVAGLLLSRGATRRAEMGVRDALGAARWRLVRQLVVENIVLAVPGIVLGLVAGQWAVRGFVLAIPPPTRVSLPHMTDLTLDGVALALTLVTVLAVVLLCGLVPALRTSREIRVGGRGVVGRSGARAQWVLVGGQVALAVTLLSGAGLMVQSMRRLLDVSPGFQPAGLLTFTLSLSGPRYQTPEAVTAFFSRVTDELRALPGVEAVSYIDQLPLTGSGNSGSFSTVGEPDRADQDVLLRSVDAAYFDVMGITFEGGRRFTAGDTPASPRVVLVNHRLAHVRFGGSAIGRRILFPFTGADPFTIIGVVGDEQFDAVDQPIQPVVYFAATQLPAGAQSLVVRTTSAPMSVLPAVRARVAALDSSLPVFGVATMEDIAGASDAVFRRRAVMTLLLGFAVASLVLAAIGMYGVLAQVVAERTREIGVRLALGARAASVITSVLGRGAVAACAGLAVGLAGSVVLGRALGALLFGTPPADAVILLTVSGVIAAAVTIAAVVPTRRALRIDPMEALRREG